MNIGVLSSRVVHGVVSGHVVAVVDPGHPFWGGNPFPPLLFHFPPLSFLSVLSLSFSPPCHEAAALLWLQGLGSSAAKLFGTFQAETEHLATFVWAGL